MGRQESIIIDILTRAGHNNLFTITRVIVDKYFFPN